MTAPSSALPLRPRSAAEVLDVAFGLLRRHAAPLCTIAAVMAMPVTLARAVQMRNMPPMSGLFAHPAAVLAASGRSGLPPTLLAVVIAGYVAGAVAFFWGGAALIAACDDGYRGAVPDAATALGRGRGRFWAMVGMELLRVLALAVAIIGIGVVFAVATLLIGVIVALGTSLGGTGGKSIGMIVGMIGGLGFTIAMFAGMLWPIARLCLAAPVVVLEGSDPWTALKRSMHLTRGATRALMLVMAVFVVAYYVALLPGLLLTLLVSPALGAVAEGLVQVIASPLLATMLVSLYYDARVRHEALDLEAAAAALATTEGIPSAV